MRPVGGDSVEREVAEQRLRRPISGQQPTDTKFGQTATLHLGTQTAQEFHHGHAVTNHGAAEAVGLYGVLHGFHRRYGQRRVYPPVRAHAII